MAGGQFRLQGKQARARRGGKALARTSQLTRRGTEPASAMVSFVMTTTGADMLSATRMFKAMADYNSVMRITVR